MNMSINMALSRWLGLCSRKATASRFDSPAWCVRDGKSLEATTRAMQVLENYQKQAVAAALQRRAPLLMIALTCVIQVLTRCRVAAIKAHATMIARGSLPFADRVLGHIREFINVAPRHSAFSMGCALQQGKTNYACKVLCLLQRKSHIRRH